MEILWTEARIGRLRQMCTEGQTYDEMASAFGVSRSAISGKIWRLRITNGRARSSGNKSPLREKTLKFRVKQEAPSLPVFGPFIGIPFTELNSTHCRYPQGEGVNILFCGQPKKAGSSYCENCHVIVYVPPRSRIPNAKPDYRPGVNNMRIMEGAW